MENKGKKKMNKASNAKLDSPSKANAKGGQEGTSGKSAKRKKIRIRPPRSAAVILTLTSLTRAEIMTEARRRIKLEELGITYLRSKIAATGAVILEIPGEAVQPRPITSSIGSAQPWLIKKFGLLDRLSQPNSGSPVWMNRSQTTT